MTAIPSPSLEWISPHRPRGRCFSRVKVNVMGSPKLTLTMLNAFVDGGVAAPVHLHRLFADDFVRRVDSALEVDQVKSFCAVHAAGDRAHVPGVEHDFDAGCVRAEATHAGRIDRGPWTKVQLRVRVSSPEAALSHAFTVHVFPSGRVQLQGKPPDHRATPGETQRFVARTACLVNELLERNGAARRVAWACQPRVVLWVFSAHSGINVHGWGAGSAEREFAALLSSAVPDARTQLRKSSTFQRHTLLAHREVDGIALRLSMWRTGSMQIKVSGASTHAADGVPALCAQLAERVIGAVEAAVDARHLLHAQGAPRARRCDNAAREIAWLTLRGKPMRRYTSRELQALLAAEGVRYQVPARPGWRWCTGARKKWLFVQAKQALEAPPGCDLEYLLDIDRCFTRCRSRARPAVPP